MRSFKLRVLGFTVASLTVSDSEPETTVGDATASPVGFAMTAHPSESDPFRAAPPGPDEEPDEAVRRA
ncbi:hypothetical protein [Nocardioides alkalitolerans]|uniref:hypothetical protein n=1 Tax=Nocardioides alkalitolerans TaxID=281714 RepID=UPI000406D288|nr:hypothetical protein [Nocardioides alkalitolerans]